MAVMLTITERCILWNSQRYDQVYDYELAAKLLLEETQELYDAQCAISKMDAVGDIVFVAIGVLWKLGLSAEFIYDIFHGADLDKLDMKDAYGYLTYVELKILDELELNENQPGQYAGVSLACFSVFITAIGALRGIGLQHRFYDIVHAICDSNATKEIKGKTASNVKANISKGAGFIPPTETLTKIYMDSFPKKTESVQ